MLRVIRRINAFKILRERYLQSRIPYSNYQSNIGVE